MQCPQPQTLQQLLDEALPSDQQTAVQAHLEGCAACQNTIERLAAGGVTWDKAAHNLAAPPAKDETALLAALENLQHASTDAERTRAEAVSPSGEDDLSFLQPSQKPGSLGRLDEFEILSVVGKGGFGIVLKAFDETLHRIVAIKVMAPHMAVSGAARQRFTKEAKAAAAITHENVVTIHAVGKDAKIPYLVMQFVSGVTLGDKIDKCGSLGVKEILRIGLQTAEGLAAAHKQGLVHRDIKPGNILLENGVERVKITDFGLARAVDDSSVTQSGTVAGTPMYMSPEQANGETVDHRSDLFSLGSVLYVMCTGRPPFRATTTMAVLKRVCDDTPTPVHEVNADVPGWLGDIIVKLHAKNPADRYQTAHELAALLGKYLAELQFTGHVHTPAALATPAVGPVSAAPKSRRWPAAVLISCMFAVPILGFALAGEKFGWFAWQTTTTNKEEEQSRAFVPVFGGPDWRQLYDGKGYTGWKAIGNSNAGSNFLLFPGGSVDTLDKMPRNFHLRMEVNLFRGQGTLRFHAQPRVEQFNQPLPKDGWFLNFTENPTVKGMVDGQVVAKNPAHPDAINMALASSMAKLRDWFYLEVIARDAFTDVLVDGKKVMTLKHPDNLPTAGVISLWNNGRGDDQIAFRNIEIKELPTIRLPLVAEPGWVQLFNGKDTLNWKTHENHLGNWQVSDGQLVCSQAGKKGAWLFSESAAYNDFQLRVEYKIAKGTARLVVRSTLKPDDGIQMGLFDPEGLLYSVPPGEVIQLPAAPKDEKPAGQWLTLEVSCVGARRTVKLDGKTIQEGADPKAPRQGHIALSVGGKDVLVHFRKIDIKALPASPIETKKLAVAQLLAQGARIWLTEDQRIETPADVPPDTVRFLKVESITQPLGGTALQPLGEKALLVLFRDMPDIDNLILRGHRLSDDGFRQLAAYPFMKRVKQLTLQSEGLTDDGLRHLAACAKLEELTLHECPKITGKGFNHLKAVRRLLVLMTPFSPIEGGALAHLRNLKLKTVSFADGRLDDDSVAQLAKIDTLRRVNLGANALTDKTCSHLVKLTKLERLELNGTKISDAGLEALGQMTTLRHLNIGNNSIGDVGLKHLTGLNALTELHLDGTQVTKAGAETLAKSLPRCQIRYGDGIIIEPSDS